MEWGPPQDVEEMLGWLRNSVGRVDVLILENNNIPHLPSRAFGMFVTHSSTSQKKNSCTV